jgi:hypothetical protein
MTTLQQYQEDTLKKFEEKFVPLKPGFSMCKDWVKNLEGTTANYMTLQSFIKETLKGQLEVVVDMVEKNKIPSKVIECTCVPREGDCAYCQQEQKDKSHNIALSEISTPLLEQIKRK